MLSVRPGAVRGPGVENRWRAALFATDSFSISNLDAEMLGSITNTTTTTTTTKTTTTTLRICFLSFFPRLDTAAARNVTTGRRKRRRNVF